MAVISVTLPCWCLSSSQKFFVLLSTEFPRRQNPIQTGQRVCSKLCCPFFKHLPKIRPEEIFQHLADGACIYSERRAASLLPFSNPCCGDMDFCHMKIFLVFCYISKKNHPSLRGEKKSKLHTVVVMSF